MKLKSIVLLGLLVFGLVGCSEQSSSDKDETPKTDDTPVVVDDNDNDEEKGDTDLLRLTVEELAEFNGKDGNNAYVAVNGVIYDVTGVSAWTNGSHNGASAGNDVSSFINGAPHGDSVLSDLDVVGELID